MTAPTFPAMLLISCCMSVWKSLWASWVSRSNCLFFSSMVRDAADAFGVGQLRALRLQLLGQVIDLVGQGLDLCAPGIVFLLQVSEVTLKFVGLGDRGLKGDYRDLGRGGGRRSGRLLREPARLLFDRRRQQLRPRPAKGRKRADASCESITPLEFPITDPDSAAVNAATLSGSLWAPSGMKPARKHAHGGIAGN